MICLGLERWAMDVALVRDLEMHEIKITKITDEESVSHQQQVVVASLAGCLKMFFFTPLDPSAKRLGVSKICNTKYNSHQLLALSNSIN